MEGWRAQRAILPEFKKAVLPELVWPSTSHTSVRAGPRHITIILSIIYLLIIVPSQTMAAAAALFMSHGRHRPTHTPTAITLMFRPLNIISGTRMYRHCRCHTPNNAITHTGSIISLPYKYNNQMVDIMSRPGPLDTLTKCVPAPSLGIIIIIICCRYFNIMSRPGPLDTLTKCVPAPSLGIIIIILCCRYFNNMWRRDRLPRSSGQAPPLALLLL